MGDTALNGGGLAIESGAAVHLQDARVTDNVAAGARGIWAASGGALTALDTAVTGNGSGGYGGGMIVNGMAVMQNVEIGGNDAARWGGGVDLDLGGSLTLINATVHGNTAGSGAGGGGGVDAWIGTLDVNASTFTGNAAAGRGGGFISWRIPTASAPSPTAFWRAIQPAASWKAMMCSWRAET
jgi:hypothetical protein